MISSISSLEIINVVEREATSKGHYANIRGRTHPNMFLWIASSVADAVAVNPNGIKTLLANGFSTFFIKVNHIFSNGHNSLPKYFLDCRILYNRVFGNFILPEELFAKALRSFET